MTFFRLILRNLSRRPARSLLTAAGVALGVAVGVGMAGIAWGFQRTQDSVYAARGADMIVTRLTARRPLPTPFEQARAQELAAIPGVEAVAGIVWDMLSIDGGPTMVVWGWEPGSFLWDHLTVHGEPLQRGATDSDCVYLGQICAEMLKKNVGDTVQIESRPLRVAGIFESSAVFENGAAILPLPVMQSILGTEGKVNFLNVRLAPGMTPEQFESLRQNIQAKFRGLRAFRAEEMNRNSVGIQAAKAMSLATSILAFTIGTLGVMNTMLMSVFERTSELGLLAAVGWRRRRILALVLLESTTLSLLGALAGVGLGIAGVRAIQTLDYMRGKIDAHFSLGMVGVALAVAILLGMLGGVLPAVRAALMHPQTALRSE